jgi:transmembrane sensor
MTHGDKITASERAKLEATAADWISRRDAGWSDDEQRQCETWCRAHPSHLAAWQAVESSWLAFDSARDGGAGDAMIIELATRARRRQRRQVVTGVAVIGTLGWFLAVSPKTMNQPTAVRVVRDLVVRPETRTLEDGSVIELNHGAAVAVHFTNDQRRVRLTRGEAHFVVTKDPARPFVVSAGDLAVKAVGTAFAVRLGTAAIDVMVTEGRVAVAANDAAAAKAASSVSPVYLDAGERISRRTDNVAPLVHEPIPAAEMNRLHAWRGPRLELSGTALHEAVSCFNRENRLRIVVGDASLGGMQLSGVFALDNAEGFVRLLESQYGVVVERRTPAEVVLRNPR